MRFALLDLRPVCKDRSLPQVHHRVALTAHSKLRLLQPPPLRLRVQQGLQLLQLLQALPDRLSHPALQAHQQHLPSPILPNHPIKVRLPLRLPLLTHPNQSLRLRLLHHPLSFPSGPHHPLARLRPRPSLSRSAAGASCGSTCASRRPICLSSLAWTM